MRGGNRYEATIIGVSQQGISIIIREVYRHRTLQKVYSFPTKAKGEHPDIPERESDQVH